jgi:hypothetical protein
MYAEIPLTRPSWLRTGVWFQTVGYLAIRRSRLWLPSFVIRMGTD